MYGTALRANARGGLSEGERLALGQEEVVNAMGGVRTNVRYKKPKARGPNPLSVKKKSENKRSATREGGGGGGGEGDGGAKKKRKRR